jgi:hypothetical protein
MGVVYRVRDRETFKEFALKTLPGMARSASQTRARFQKRDQQRAPAESPGDGAVY